MSASREGCRLCGVAEDDFERFILEVYRLGPEEVKAVFRALATSAARDHGMRIDLAGAPSAQEIEYLKLIHSAQDKTSLEECRACLFHGVRPGRC